MLIVYRCAPGLAGLFSSSLALVLCALLLYFRSIGHLCGFALVAIAAILVTVLGATSIVLGFFSDPVLATRNFYGVIRIPGNS